MICVGEAELVPTSRGEPDAPAGFLAAHDGSTALLGMPCTGQSIESTYAVSPATPWISFGFEFCAQITSPFPVAQTTSSGPAWNVLWAALLQRKFWPGCVSRY